MERFAVTLLLVAVSLSCRSSSPSTPATLLAAPPPRTCLLTGGTVVRLGDVARPAASIPDTGLAFHVAATEARVLRFSLGVRPAETRRMARFMVAHDLEDGVHSAPAPPSPRPVPEGPQVKGLHLFHVEIEGVPLINTQVEPGHPGWSHYEVAVPAGTTSIVFRTERAPGSRPVSPGEEALVGDPVLVATGGPSGDLAMLVSVDTLRADRLGCYGAPNVASPQLDSFARRARLFTEARSTASWTLPAHASMLCSRYGTEVGAIDALSRAELPATTLAATLRGAGRDTVAHTSHVLVSAQKGLAPGFSLFRTHQSMAAAQAVDDVLPELENPRPGGLFLFLHLFDPHWDYRPEAPWDHIDEDDPGGTLTGSEHELVPYFAPERPLAAADLAHILALYDGEIAATDHALGRLLRAVAPRADHGTRTVVMITADHGEEFKDHGSLGHGTTLLDEQIHVPLLVMGIGPPSIDDTPASLLDVAPTLTTALGVTCPRDWRGRDLAAPPPAQRTVMAETRLFRRDLTAAVTAGVKVIDDFRPEGGATSFDLGSDPGERSPAHSPTVTGAARWLRDAFEPGIHTVATTPEQARQGATPQPVPDLPGLWHGLGDPSRADARTVLVVPTSAVRQLELEAKEAGAPRTAIVVAAKEPAIEPDEVETLRELGYLQ